ncbi:MAG: alpha-amylase [Planctomycetota bacterium]|nr:MAG: alpha-amylase [Planctomycetota bacterium]
MCASCLVLFRDPRICTIAPRTPRPIGAAGEEPGEVPMRARRTRQVGGVVVTRMSATCGTLGNALALALLLVLTGCGGAGGGGGGGGTSGAPVRDNAALDWRDQVIYQVITDRFADGDPNNNWNVDRRALGRYQGGDWQGLIDHLGYLRELGVTAVWISPHVKNVEIDAGVAGYHGYWTQDFTAVNPHFGDLGKLRQMVNVLHANDILVIADVVTNHVGQLFYYDINLNGTPEETLYGSGASPGSPLRRVTEYDPDWDPTGIHAQVGYQRMGLAPIRWIRMPAINRMPPQPPEFQNPEWYHRRGRVVPDPNGNWPRDQVLLADFPGGLKDLATERQDVRDALVRVFADWIRKVDFDGFRIDTLKHVEQGFWRYWCPRIREAARQRGKHNFFLFGEAFDGDDVLVGSYTQSDMVDSAFYFPQKYVAFDGVIKYNHPTREIEDLWNRKSFYGQQPQPGGVGVAPAHIPVNFIDNHDVPRYLAGEPDDRKLRLAICFLMSIEGVPCLYYGTEQGFRGAGDPANRERLWDTGFDTSGSLFRHVKRWIALRKANVALRRGDQVVRWSTTRTGGEEDAGIFAFERVHPQQTLLFVMNVNPNHASRTQFGSARMQTSFLGGTVLHDLADPGYRVTVQQGGTVVVEVPPLGARLLAPAP